VLQSINLATLDVSTMPRSGLTPDDDSYRWEVLGMVHADAGGFQAINNSDQLVGMTSTGVVSLRGSHSPGSELRGLAVAALGGACCPGTHCVVTTEAACASRWQGSGTTCGAAANPTTCCKANYNGQGGVSVQDIFDFLAGYFAGNARADINSSGAVTVQDIFDFLAAYFVGCP
jgi:hypothetical protein